MKGVTRERPNTDKIGCGTGFDEVRVDAIDIVAPGCERIVRSR